MWETKVQQNMEPVRGFSPDWSTHPGEHVEEYLEVNGWSQAELARRAGLTPKHVNEIIKGKNPVTPDTALKLERVLGLSAEIWLGLQSTWDLHNARHRDRQVSGDIRAWMKRFPLKELRKRGALPDTTDEGDLFEGLLGLLGIGNAEAYEAKLNSLAVHHRQARGGTSSPEHVFAWLMLGEQKARSLPLPPFDKEKFEKAVGEIRELTLESPDVFETRMLDLCHAAGVALVFEKPISKTCLFGSARWIERDRAIIQMSLRMKYNDHFWWTFFHECGHIVLHQGMNFADDKNAVGGGCEEEADAFAEHQLYGKGGLQTILADPHRSEYGVRALARSLRLHPGIVVGMLQHYGVLPHHHLNSLKAVFDWTD
jgi:HTH-type transcriptional regulator / antitoxin HigA